MKIACDFVSPAHLPVLEELENDLRLSNLRQAFHDDLLHITRLVWFAWRSCEVSFNIA
jgi:hypothetical protein